MPPPGLHAHAAALMRSLLFVPADGGRKLDKAMASGADAVIVDLEDSISAAGKADARKSAAAFLQDAVEAAERPRLLVRVNGIATGLTDADLDAVVPARPDAIMLPKAEGGAGVIHADAKLAAREAIGGLPDGHIKIVAIATETATALFLAGTYRGASARLEGLTWGAEDLSAELGAEANRDARGPFPRSLSARARALPCRRRGRAGAGDRHGLCRFPQSTRCCAARPRRRAATASPARWRSIPRRCRSSTRCSRRRRRRSPRRAPWSPRSRQSRQGHGRHRRRDVRPPAPRARQAIAGARKRSGIGLMPLSCLPRYFLP